MWVQSLDWEDPPEEGVVTHSNILAWRTPQTEEPCRLQSSPGSQRVQHVCMHVWLKWLSTCACMDIMSNVFKKKNLNAYLSGTRKKWLSRRLGWLCFMVSSNSKIRWHQNPCLWFKCIGWLPGWITTGNQGAILWRLLVELRRAQYPISESITAHNLEYVLPHSFFFSPYVLCCDFFSNWQLFFSKATIYLDLFYLCIVSLFFLQKLEPNT